MSQQFAGDEHIEQIHDVIEAIATRDSKAVLKLIDLLNGLSFVAERFHAL